MRGMRGKLAAKCLVRHFLKVVSPAIDLFISKARNKTRWPQQQSFTCYILPRFFLLVFSSDCTTTLLVQWFNIQLNICWKCLSNFEKNLIICFIMLPFEFLIFILVDPRFQQTLSSSLAHLASSDPADHQPVPVARQLHRKDPPSRVLKVIKQCP